MTRYVHLGTGNYHARTARLYTDYGLFTCDRQIGEDVQKVFHQLTAMGKAERLKKILQSPFTLHRTMISLIEREADNAREGKPARVAAKMNSLLEPQVIKALYQASQAGVKIELVVRGICALRPGIEGISDNITVRSIVGRFLEHTRVFCFENGGDRLVYLSSADWMGRNFFNRVETCFPVEDEALKARVLQEFHHYLSDNSQAWQMASDGSYSSAARTRSRRSSAQEALLTELADLNPG